MLAVSRTDAGKLLSVLLEGSAKTRSTSIFSIPPAPSLPPLRSYEGLWLHCGANLFLREQECPRHAAHHHSSGLIRRCHRVMGRANRITSPGLGAMRATESFGVQEAGEEAP